MSNGYCHPARGEGSPHALVRGNSRRIKIMRFRPANIRLINRRSFLPRLLLALSSKNGKSNDKNDPTDVRELTGSLYISLIRIQKTSAYLPVSTVAACGRLCMLHPPPNARTRATLASMRRRSMSTAMRSFCKRVLCVLITSR